MEPGLADQPSLLVAEMRDRLGQLLVPLVLYHGNLAKARVSAGLQLLLAELPLSWSKGSQSQKLRVREAVRD